MKNPMHNPLPASLSSECKKAAAILESFIDPKLKIDGQIPRRIFEGAKGIAIYTAFRVGFLGSIRFGSGLIIARLPDGTWTAPSAIAMGGVGAGGQFGAELTDFVFVLTTDAAVKTFMQSGSLTLGGNISMAVGPVGRSAEASGVVGTKGAAGVFAYSKTRGLYGGLTVEGGVLVERGDANKKFYGRKVRAKELLTGSVPSPSEADVLMEVLNGSFFQFAPAESEQQAESSEVAEGGDSAEHAEVPESADAAEGAEATATTETSAQPSAAQTTEPQESAHSTSEAPNSPAIEHEEPAARDAPSPNADISTSEPNQPQPTATEEQVPAETVPANPSTLPEQTPEDNETQKK
ncbi:unnamed protein product [Penicillium bialowiezense]